MKKTGLILFLFLFCVSNFGHAQTSTFSADSLNILALEIQETDAEASFIAASAAYTVAQRNNDTLMMARSLVNIGLALYFADRFDSAVAPLKRSYRFYQLKNNPEGMSVALNNLGMVYWQMNQMHLAEEYYRASLNIAQSLKDSAGMASSLNNLGMIYQMQEKNEKAMEMYKLSALFDEQTGDATGLAMTWINIGGLYSEMEQYETGNFYLYKALKYFTECNDSRNQSMTLVNIGDNFRLKKQYSQAQTTLMKAISLSRENDNLSELIVGYVYYSRLLLDLGKDDSSDIYLFDAMELCVETGNNRIACDAMLQRSISLANKKQYELSNQFLLNAYEFATEMNYVNAIIDILERLSENNAALGNFSEAWKYQKMLTEFNATQTEAPQSVASNEIEAKAKPMQDGFTVQTMIYGILSGLILVFLLLTVWLYSRIRTLQKQIQLHSAAGKERE